MSLCDCAFGPRCESNRCCADEQATAGVVKDQRTGEIRARADWSVLCEPHRKCDRLRASFYCNECFEALKEARSKPIPGIDKPEGASDFWRPSIMEMIRLAAIKMNHEERMREASEAMMQAPLDYVPRGRNWSPAQRRTAMFLREKMREMRR